MKRWRCKTCGKEATETGPKDEAAPAHVAHRGYDIGNCPGVMERVDGEAGMMVVEHEARQ